MSLSSSRSSPSNDFSPLVIAPLNPPARAHSSRAKDESADLSGVSGTDSGEPGERREGKEPTTKTKKRNGDENEKRKKRKRKEKISDFMNRKMEAYRAIIKGTRNISSSALDAMERSTESGEQDEEDRAILQAAMEKGLKQQVGKNYLRNRQQLLIFLRARFGNVLDETIKKFEKSEEAFKRARNVVVGIR